MKKYIIILLSLICIIGCEKDPAPVNEISHVKLYLTTPETKTVNAGMSTKWVSGDRVLLYYSPTGTSDYVKVGRVDNTDPEKGIFEADLPTGLTEGNSYDWWAFYPFNSNHKVNKTGSIVIGCAYNQSQKQTGNNSLSHLAGTNFPLFGSVKSVSASDYPVIQMKNVASVIEYKILNSTEKDITVTEVDFTAPNNIIGRWYVDYSGEEPVCTVANARQMSSTVKLAVSGGEAIKPGESALFYAGIAPSTFESGSSLSVSVTASDGSSSSTQTSTLQLTESLSFKAGTINTLNLNYSSTQ